MAMVVPIHTVHISSEDEPRYRIKTVNRMMDVLRKQGQIEPLQVQQIKGCDEYVTFKQDTWAYEILRAAEKLGWPTILIVVMKRYEA